MPTKNRTRHRIAAAVAAACTGLTLASAASAVDLRDWGKKYATSERFVVLSQFSNQAVLDKETQLVWEQRIESIAGTYGVAHSFCGARAIGGRYGWRLPTQAELLSLLDPTASTTLGLPKLPAGHPFANVQPNMFYWTSTRDPNPNIAASWIQVNLSTANTESHGYSWGGRIWCVRGSQQ